MEVKVLCPCGTKFKFDIEPVRGRMPTPISCPACGADATGHANAVIEETLRAAGQTAEPNAPAPLIPPPPPVLTAPAGSSINRPRVISAVTSVESNDPPPIAPPLRSKSLAKKRQNNPVVKVLTTVLAVAVIGFGAWRFGYKWYKRISLIAQVASAAGNANSDSDKSESSGPVNLWYEKCAVLFIKHTNHLDVAKACQDYWATKLHKKLALLDSSREYMEPGEYELIPAHNGYVRIVGAFEWPIPQHEGVAQHLSQTFGTLVFEWRTETFADTYHFGVYDQGARKFHAQMDIKMSGGKPQEIVTTEGNEFAIANGYKPGPEGFKEFGDLDADKITQRLGMNLGDEKEGVEIKTMLLKETGPK
jgi:hypothetical protein